MSGECVYGCIHPWWGGGGTCITSNDSNPVCACDAGYASRDTRGNPSCVPRRVLISAYIALGVASVLAAALMVWNINQYRHLPVRVQSARKTLFRMRALIATRCDAREACWTMHRLNSCRETCNMPAGTITVSWWKDGRPQVVTARKQI